MAHGVRFVKRNRSRVGRASGSVICTIHLPALGEQFDRRFSFRANDVRLVGLARFIRKELVRAESVLEDGHARVEAFVRMPNGRLGRRRLASWRHGESVEECLSTAVEEWRRLPKEEDWAATVDVEVPTPSRVKGRQAQKPTL
jgi:hypothetical protein